MTEEEYTKLEDGVEIYLHNGKGEYWVPNVEIEVIMFRLMWKQSTRPDDVWKIQYVSQTYNGVSSGHYQICFDDLSCWNSQIQYFIDTNNNHLCCKCGTIDQHCYCFVDTTEDYQHGFFFKSLDDFNALEQHVKVCYEPVIVEFVTPPFILK